MTAPSPGRLSEVQRVILQAVIDLQPNAYGATISERTGFFVGFIYDELEPLEANYLVGSKVAPGGPERGGRAKRLWAITPAGRRAIAEKNQPTKETTDNR